MDLAAAQDRVEGNRYQNPRYGVEIEKPTRWHFITAATIIDVARKAAGMPSLGSDVDPVKAAGFAVIVSKVPVLGREVVPQVVLMVHDLPRTPTDVVEACERLRSGMNEPETVTPTRAVVVDGRPAARLDFKGYVDGALVRATALCTFQDRRAFVVAGQAARRRVRRGGGHVRHHPAELPAPVTVAGTRGRQPPLAPGNGSRSCSSTTCPTSSAW